MNKYVRAGIYLALAMAVVIMFSAYLQPAQAESRLYGFTSTPTVGTTVTDTFVPPTETPTEPPPSETPTDPPPSETPTDPPPSETPRPTETRTEGEDPTPVPTATDTPTVTLAPTITPEPPSTGGLFHSGPVLWLGLLVAILGMGLLVGRLTSRGS